MINQEIAAAKQAKRQRLLIGLIVVLALTLAAVALLYVADNIQLSGTKEPKQAAEPTRSAPVPPVKQADPNDPELRQQYLDAFSRYENELKPALAKIDIQQWDAERAVRLKQQEKQAIESFGKGDYVTAVNSINTLNADAEQTLKDSQAAYEKAMQQAQTAYDERDHPNAELAINTALMHQAESTEAQALAEKIAQIPEILALQQTIAKAKAENRPEQELEAIEKLLTLTPDDATLKQRAEALRKQFADNRFNRAVASADQAIASRNVDAAQTAIQQAKQIYPSRPEIQRLSTALSQLQSSLRYEDHLRQAKAAQSADDWTKAEQQFSLTLKERPNDSALNAQVATAKKIVNLQRQMQQLLQSPYRLANDASKGQAEKVLADATSVKANSASLTKLAAQLDSTVKSVNTPVNVEVSSDGKTAVSVRGVGQVGTATSKTIQLKPGVYTFEGKREGYRSKLVEITIPLNQSRYSVRVVADERI